MRQALSATPMEGLRLALDPEHQSAEPIVTCGNCRGSWYGTRDMHDRDCSAPDLLETHGHVGVARAKAGHVVPGSRAPIADVVKLGDPCESCFYCGQSVGSTHTVDCNTREGVVR